MRTRRACRVGDKHLKKPKAKGRGHLADPPDPTPTNHLSPVFCLRYLKSGYSLNDCGDAEAAAFVKKVKQLCDLDWQTIQNSSREGQGHEKMPVNQIRPDLPRRVTPDVSELLVFRFGGLARFLGLRHERVFEVYLIDPEGDAYEH